MAPKKTKEQITKNMKSVRTKGTAIEELLYRAFLQQGIYTFTRNDKTLIGKPDFVFHARKIAVFCDGDYWHGYNWDIAKHQIKSNQEFWIKKIEKNMKRDIDVTKKLEEQGWRVFRFWGHEIKHSAIECALKIVRELRILPSFPYRTIDLCAGSRVGLQEGFENAEKGQIFFHIADIMKRTRPIVAFLENVDRLVTHNNGKTFSTIIHTLIFDLRYHIIGVRLDENNVPIYDLNSFIRNSRDFGVPQNRPRTYIVCFDTERFSYEQFTSLQAVLPIQHNKELYHDLNDVLDKEVDTRFYMSSGYLNTLINHRKRQEAKGYGFGYRVVNAPEIDHPVANTLMATGGSGRERNLIYDPREGIAGQMIKGKKTPLNNMGIRMMTPNEWGKLQGFINYAFLDENGNDLFSFPDDVPNVQRYKQLGNAVTVPVIKEMAEYILKCIENMTN